MDKWIPVEEGLPKETGRYLVTYHEWSRGDYLPEYNDTNVRVMKCVSNRNCGFTHSKVKFVWQFPRNIDPKAEKDVSREVIAWMPLPTPYKGDKYTTADNIRSMTDEQLAEFLKSYPGFNHLSYKEVLNWLKIEDGGTDA